MLGKLAASVPVKAIFSTTDFILNGKAIGAGKLNRISFIHEKIRTCLILNRQKIRMIFNFSATL